MREVDSEFASPQPEKYTTVNEIAAIPGNSRLQEISVI